MLNVALSRSSRGSRYSWIPLVSLNWPYESIRIRKLLEYLPSFKINCLYASSFEHFYCSRKESIMFEPLICTSSASDKTKFKRQNEISIHNIKRRSCPSLILQAKSFSSIPTVHPPSHLMSAIVSFCYSPRCTDSNDFNNPILSTGRDNSARLRAHATRSLRPSRRDDSARPRAPPRLFPPPPPHCTAPRPAPASAIWCSPSAGLAPKAALDGALVVPGRRRTPHHPLCLMLVLLRRLGQADLPSCRPAPMP